MYFKMYMILFNAITDALRDMEKEEILSAKRRLKEAQQEAEDIFIEWAEKGTP